MLRSSFSNLKPLSCSSLKYGPLAAGAVKTSATCPLAASIADDGTLAHKGPRGSGNWRFSLDKFPGDIA